MTETTFTVALTESELFRLSMSLRHARDHHLRDADRAARSGSDDGRHQRRADQCRAIDRKFTDIWLTIAAGSEAQRECYAAIAEAAGCETWDIEMR